MAVTGAPVAGPSRNQHAGPTPPGHGRSKDGDMKAIGRGGFIGKKAKDK